MVAALAVLLLAGIQNAFPEDTRSPEQFGRAELAAALAEKGVRDVRIETRLNEPPRNARMKPVGEAYFVAFGSRRIEVSANDDNGLMYGLLEAAERIRNAGRDAWKQPAVTGKPFLEDRGLNIFLPLPWDYEKNFVDNDPAALVDPNRWFFHNEDYWRTLFRQMALSRLNWLDIHGPYDLDTTRFPNLYAYFIQSEKFPLVGVAPEIKKKNLDRLNWIIDLAHRHGIRMSLMSYEARFDTPHNLRPPYKGDEPEVYEYTKEVVEKMIRMAPGLDKIGFRIGESGRGAEFFKCYTEAVKASGRNIPLYTRSWVTRKARVVPLARTSDDFTVEIKYNGEQWGAPYIMSGGRTANWYSYWYEDYLSDSGNEPSKRMWPGNEIPSASGGRRGRPAEALLDRIVPYRTPQKGEKIGAPLSEESAQDSARAENAEGRWPAQPYKIVWQVRANGTHRLLPFYQPQWTRTSIQSMKIGTASGYTIESMSSYFPQEPNYYWQGPRLAHKWNFERDYMYLACWGRLGYDPSTPDWKFDRMIERNYGANVGGPLAKAWSLASKTVPTAFMAYGLGPDHRSHAPEFEWGGDTNQFLEGEPFESHVFMSAKERLALLSTGGKDGRLDPAEAAALLSSSSLWSVDAFMKNDSFFTAENRPELAELVTGIKMLWRLARFYGARLNSGYLLGLEETKQERDYRQLFMQLDIARSALEDLAAEKNYKPFSDRLRMHTHAFSWKSEAEKLGRDVARLEQLFGRPSYASSSNNRETTLRGLPTGISLDVKIDATHVECSIPASKIAQAWLLSKPLPSSTFYHKSPMQKVANRFVATFHREPWGHAVAAEVQLNNGVVRRIPWWESGQPYTVVPTQSKPTPPIYSSEEAMTFLDPKILEPEKFGWLVVATRGEDFHRLFSKQTQRKLLPAVERGMNLLVMQQDLTSGRYPMDWLPLKPRVANRNLSVFDPGAALGLSKIETRDIMWQPFEPTEGWEVFGNGGVARYKHGSGSIWMVQARLTQRMNIPDAARNLLTLLRQTAPEGKSAILVDAGSEGDLSTSVIPDFMNAHEIPFLTLGEVVAREQGMNSLTPIPGPAMDDDILGGKGREMANKWLRDQVIVASSRPAPESLAEFESERKRRKAELNRCLGLDPMPLKTPLNARITGTIQRNGYKIEKLVFESRPNFFVTGHIYLPDPMPIGKLPVVVHVNGHWAHKKNEDRVQLRAAFCALRGYMAIAIDSPGHSFEGNSLIERRAEGDHNDWFLAMATNATGYYVWDCIRALDYLETRPEADMSRIGITGASGGGLATLYAFAADDRYRAAIPVVYMSSMAIAPENGCLCNHVPATCQIGDRSDVMAIQAPKPVLLMGAEVDPEFPPDAMRSTGFKMNREWALFGKGDLVNTKIFLGGHDYSQPMREAMIGFFDKHLKAVGNGTPVPQPPISAINSEDRQLLAFDPPSTNERTMRELSLDYLANAPKNVSLEQVFAMNGGKPEIAPENLKLSGAPPKIVATFEAESGLVTPTIMLTGRNLDEPVTIIVSDDGKATQMARDSAKTNTRLYVDILGTGELSGIEQRYAIYLGRSVAYIGGIQISGAAKLVRQNGHGGEIHVEAHGPLASLAAMYAALFEPSIFTRTSATDALQEWADAFKPGVNPLAVQPRAHLLGSLENLREKVKNATWSFR